MLTFRIDSLDLIQRTARSFLDHFRGSKVFAFYGPLGSGKTTFIKALCKELETEDNINSPSFSIINIYHSEKNGEICHFDFYRIEKQEEAYDLGYEEYFFSGKLCFIEWPEIIEDLLPEGTIHVRILTDDAPARVLEVFGPTGT